MAKSKTRSSARQKRHRRVRKNMAGTSEKPRLNVYRSNREISAQIINDDEGTTIVSASSLEGSLKSELTGKKKSEQAGYIGKVIGERAKKSGVTKVVFDRGGYRYIGRVKALADGARKAGLEF